MTAPEVITPPCGGWLANHLAIVDRHREVADCVYQDRSPPEPACLPSNANDFAYQYFPNKDALLVGLTGRHMHEAREQILAAINRASEEQGHFPTCCVPSSPLSLICTPRTPECTDCWWNTRFALPSHCFVSARSSTASPNAAVAELVELTIRILPGLLLVAGCLLLCRGIDEARTALLIVGFVLLRDTMTPVGLWRVRGCSAVVALPRRRRPWWRSA